MQTNNKLREAVVLALSLLDLKEGVPYKTVSQKDIDFMKAALAAPARNCEVGTPSEQYQRFLKYCKKNTGGCDRADRYSNPCAYCFSQWAQMPYKKGETNGSK